MQESHSLEHFKVVFFTVVVCAIVRVCRARRASVRLARNASTGGSYIFIYQV